jgi:hypothetical protein
MQLSTPDLCQTKPDMSLSRHTNPSSTHANASSSILLPKTAFLSVSAAPGATPKLLELKPVPQHCNRTLACTPIMTPNPAVPHRVQLPTATTSLQRPRCTTVKHKTSACNIWPAATFATTASPVQLPPSEMRLYTSSGLRHVGQQNCQVQCTGCKQNLQPVLMTPHLT